MGEKQRVDEPDNRGGDNVEMAAESQGKMSGDRLTSLTASIEDVLFILDIDADCFTYVSPSVEKISGFTPREMTSTPLDGVFTPTSLDSMRAAVASRLETLDDADAGKRSFTVEMTQHCKEGDAIEIEMVAVLRPNDESGRLEAHGVYRNITGRKRAEREREQFWAELHHSQKMEAVGRLAGGVAHDFNNMLGVILGQAELMQSEVQQNGFLRKSIENILKAATRSAELTQQLLTFARKQTATPQVLDINDILPNILEKVSSQVRGEASIDWRPGDDVGKIRMDPEQLEQVLVSLCTNAAEAIEGEGRISVETANVSICDTIAAGGLDAPPGDYVVLSVADSGNGMSPAVRARMFEPFFTTKAPGPRTGLGLATVYGIVQQNDGFIQVDTTQGQGTVIRIHLRRLDMNIDEVEASKGPPLPKRLVRNVLLVEDEPALLTLYRDMLSQLGLSVWAAESPERALEISGSERAEIDLLITDVVMPGMNGRDLFARLLTTRPDLRCLYISGYSADVISHRGVLESGLHFLQKPFTLSALSDKLREMILVDTERPL